MAEHTAIPAADTIVRIRALVPDAATPCVGFEHPYYEIAWLPQIGPTSWLLWRTIGTRVARDGEAAWTAGALAQRHGVYLAVLFRTIVRLARFRVVRPGDNGELLVLPACVPLRPRMLREADAEARRSHAETFPELGT